MKIELKNKETKKTIYVIYNNKFYKIFDFFILSTLISFLFFIIYYNGCLIKSLQYPLFYGFLASFFYYIYLLKKDNKYKNI